MDVKFLIDKLAENARSLGTAIFFIGIFAFLLRTRVARRLRETIEETVFSNWRLALLGTTGIVLSAAAGWRTWEGMYNFTGEPLLSGMVTFGIQGIMLIVAWLIGESFATGMNARARPGDSALVSAAAQPWLGSFIGLLLFIVAFVLFLQWTGQADVKHANVENLGWSAAGDKFLILGAGILLLALFTLYAANDLVRPYVQVVRVIIRNSMLWLMFFACMATSVFFSFDSFFTAIFPQSERVRAAQLRAQNQVSGIVSDIEQALAARRASLAEEIFTTGAWKDYEHQLDAITKVATQSQDAIERYVNAQVEARSRTIKEQQERIASAEAGQAGLAGRKTSLTDEKTRLAAQRPELATDYATKKADYDTKAKEVDAKRVAALAEDKGVEGSLKAGRGPIYRQRVSELALAQGAAQVAGERMKDAQKRLSGVETRLTAIDTELATLDGDLAKYQGEADTAKQRIALADGTEKDDNNAKIDPAKTLPAFERAKSDFRADPNATRLASVQRMCNDIYGALSATPDTKPLLSDIDCDPKAVADAASGLFGLQSGTKVFQQTCVGGDKLVENKSTDDLFAFARRCLSDSALPSQDTAVLRSKINRIELSRDDKAHRFVVTLNAFQDGNRLAYLALAIAIGLDGLIFMSGLFGANAVRSPLSDIPSFKSRSGSQLEATINAALGAHPYETAWLTLTALRPITNQDGFSALADLSNMERSQADRVRMVLTAGADIGAVETVSHNPERYRVRSELREYLSSVVDKQFKTDASAKDRARLDQLVSAALAPHPRKNAGIVLNVLEPIREREGFTSMVTPGKIENEEVSRIVRRVMNAGSAVKAVEPAEGTLECYYIRPTLYETLLLIYATSPDISDDRRLLGGKQEDTKSIRLETAPPDSIGYQRQRQIEGPAPAIPHISALSNEERARLTADYRNELLVSIGLSADLVDRHLRSTEAQQAMARAWKSLIAQTERNDLLSDLVRRFQVELDARLERAAKEIERHLIDARHRAPLGAAEDRVREEVGLLMLFPQLHLIDFLISEIEIAAQYDDGLQVGEQALKDQLKYVRDGLQDFKSSNPEFWDEIRQRLAVTYRNDPPNFINKPRHHDDDDQA